MPDVSIPIGAIVTWLKKLIVGRIDSKQKRFDELFQKTFDAFLLIHRDYVCLFENVRNALIKAKMKSEEAPAILDQIHQDFSAKRGEYEGVRTQIRAMATQVITSSTDPDEQRFLWTLLCYFLEYEQPHKLPDKLDSQIELLKKEGHHGVLNTPSSYVMKALSTEQDIDKLIKVVGDKRENISAYLSDVCNTFSTLKASVYA